MTKFKCDECDNGRYYDAADGSSRHCNECNGTGKVNSDPKEQSKLDLLKELKRISKKIYSL